MNLEKIKTKLNQQMPFLSQTFKVKKIAIFGSYSRQEETANSDIDLLVDLSSPIGLIDFIKLENYLSQLLGIKVDLVTPKAIKPIIKNDIYQDLIYV